MAKVTGVKKWLFTVIVMVISWLVVEVGGHLIYLIVNGEAYSLRATQHDLTRLAEHSVGPAAAQLDPGEIKLDEVKVETIHPYLGFVHNPEKTEGTSYLGFPQERDDPLVFPGDGVLTVAIMGGSFAQGVSEVGEDTLTKVLGDQGLNARILTLSMGGYKQPQQLMSLAYLLSHGAHIDVVVNIDGFNEVALPPAENFHRGVNPFYPRMWHYRTNRLVDQDDLRALGRVALLKDRRRGWARFMIHLPAFSIVRGLAWRAFDRRLEQRIAALQKQVRTAKDGQARFMTHGPDFGIRDEDQLYDEISRHWVTCSLLMRALCDSRGIRYLHLLQPNQYDRSGRVLTGEERERAFLENHPYRPGVEAGYPRLREAGQKLLEEGVEFHDMTLIYRDIAEPVYEDNCCHPNQLGYDLIAEELGRLIGAAVAGPCP